MLHQKTTNPSPSPAAVVNRRLRKLECLYFSFGTDDVVLIVDAPDNVSAAAVGLTVAASGAVKGKLTVLLTPEEIDQAARKSPNYRPPGA